MSTEIEFRKKFLRDKIQELTEQISSGVTSKSKDGVSVSIDLNTLKSERNRLMLELNQLNTGNNANKTTITIW